MSDPELQKNTHSLASYVSMDSGRASVMKELRELFWELLDHARSKCWKKKCLTAFMIISSLVVFADLLFLGNILNWVNKYAVWMKLHIFLGTFLFIALLILATLIMVPPFILNFVCGYVYAEVSGVHMGVPAATLVSFTGCAVGASIAFVRARYMMRDLVTLFSNRYKVVRAADRAIARHGFRVFFLLRLCPIIPFNGLNYIGGITAVTMEEYVLALVGILPVTILSVLAGATTEHMVVTKQNEAYTGDQFRAYLALLAMGAIFVLAAILLIIYVARKELEKELLEEQLQDEALKAVGGGHLNRPPSPTGASTCSVHEEQPSATGASTSSTRHHNQEHALDDVKSKLFPDDEEWFWLFP